MTGNLRLFFGRWFGVVILAAIAVLVIWFILNFNFFYDKVQNKLFASDAQREIKRLENLYKNDKYGGKTPEETFDLFLAALKSGNIELASKYFVINKQDDWEKTLEEYRTQGILSEYIVELEEIRKGWRKKQTADPSVIEFNSYTSVDEPAVLKFKDQEFKIEPGEYLNVTRFEKYPSGIWKIVLL